VFAIKIIEKSFMKHEKKLHQIYLENEILSKLSHPNIIKIYGIFEERSKIYIVLEYCEKGDFFEFIKNNHPLTYETAQYYTAQVVSSLEYLHCLGIAHRDLKPENIMLDEKMRIKIIDFATAKVKSKEFNKITMKFVDIPEAELKKRTNTFVGTAEYISPEVLNDETVGSEADLWALGCVIYQMFRGQSPFKDKTEHLTFRKIREQNMVIPKELPLQAANLIRALLVADPYKRIGSGEEGKCNDFESLKKHEFFKGVDFEKVGKMEPPNIDVLKTNVFFKQNTIKSNKKEKCVYSESSKKGELQVVKEGVVKKKSPWFHYNTRKLILYNNTPKLEYLDMNKNTVKGVIYLTKECQAVSIDLNRFDLATPNRTFVFKTDGNEANTWAKSINDLINK